MNKEKKHINLSNVANVKTALNINSIAKSPYLEAWENALGTIAPAHQVVLDQTLEQLRLKFNTWNEEELKTPINTLFMEHGYKVIFGVFLF